MIFVCIDLLLEIGNDIIDLTYSKGIQGRDSPFKLVPILERHFQNYNLLDIL